MRWWLLAAAGAVPLLAAFLAVPAPDGAEEPAAPPEEADVAMTIKSSRPGCEEDDSCYSPSELSVGAGQPVTWENRDVAFHSVTSGSYDSPTDLFDSGHMDPDGRFTVEFGEPGRYDYFCTLNPWMDGTILVLEEGA